MFKRVCEQLFACVRIAGTSPEDGDGKTKTNGQNLQMKMHSACVFVHAHLCY